MMGKTSTTLAKIKAGAPNCSSGRCCHSQKDAASRKNTSDVQLEMIILSEVSQTEKDKHHMISLICGI